MKTLLRRSTSVTAVFVLPLVLSTVARAQPREGTTELRIGNTMLSIAASPVGTSGIAQIAPEVGSNVSVFSSGIGLGRFVSDNFELGGTLSYSNIDGDVQIPGIGGFLRGFTMIGPGVAGFMEGSVGVQSLVPDAGPNTTVFGLGAELGMEKFVTDSWAIRVSGGVRHLMASGDNTIDANDTIDVITLGWGIAAYF